jgi:hypothetical protein
MKPFRWMRWLVPGARRRALLAAMRAQGDAWWIVFDLPGTAFWAGSYPYLERLQRAGIVESGQRNEIGTRMFRVVDPDRLPVA